jgi:hypothetical protein
MPDLCRIPSVTDQPEVPGGGPSEDEVEPVAKPAEAASAERRESGGATADGAADDEHPGLSKLGFPLGFEVKPFRFAPKLNYTALFPRIEPPDFSAVLRPLLSDLGKAFAPLVKRLLESLPPNWPIDIDFEMLTTVIRDDGLPLVWVPRAEIVTEVLATPDRRARVEVLISRADEVVEDCRAVLGEISHDAFSGQQPLAVKALDAFEAGHHEAAQALSVVVTETAVARAFGYKQYGDIKKAVNFDPELVHFTELRVQAALAPIGAFYAAWRPSWGKPIPEALSRHVSVHQADEDHYTREDAIVAVLLVTSVLRALQELQELAEAQEGAE